MRVDERALRERHVAHEPAITPTNEVQHEKVGGFGDVLTVLTHPEDRAGVEQDPALDGRRHAPERADHHILFHSPECARRSSV